MATETPKNKDLEWEERTLCSDEACIGVIGPDGRCNECGQPYAGKLPETFGEPPDDLSLSPDEPLEQDGGTDSEADDFNDDLDLGEDEEDSHWEERILCVDENCIGVIGADGRCKECGKPLEEDD
jgi:hypothetical protein